MSTILKSAIKFPIGVLIFVGLPLVGWGVTDIRGFLGHQARLAYVVLTVLLQAGVVMLAPGVGRQGGGGKETVRRQRIAVILLQVLSLSIVIAAPWGDRREVGALGDEAWVRYPGLVLLAMGFLVMNWAEASLGKLFSIQVEVQEGHRLVTEGPYRLLRHPRYAGILLFNTGLALVFRSWLGLILVVALAGVLLWRVHDEEALMRREFGADWEAYSARSWRFIPFIY